MQQFYSPYSHRSPQMTGQPHVPPAQSHACAGPGAAPQTAGVQNPLPQYYHPQGSTYYYQQGAPEYVNPSAGTGLPATSADGIGSWFAFSNAGYLKGFAIGAGATLLITNSAVQKAMARGAVKLWSFVQGGVEEIKEQFQDIKAEMSQEK